MDKEGQVESVNIDTSSGRIEFYLKEDSLVTYDTTTTERISLVTEYIEENGVTVYTGLAQSTNYLLLIVLQYVIPILLFIVVWRFLSKGITRSMGDSMS